MALYKYLAAGKGESPHEILIEADTEKDAVKKLRSRNITPIRSFGETEVRQKTFSLTRSKVDTFNFTRQLAPLLDSYIPIERALAIIEEGAEEQDQKDFINSLRQGLHEGKKFSELVRGHGTLFPAYYANLIESGEESGCLPQVVKELYQFMEESKTLKDFIVSSSIYPLAILGVILSVVLLIFIVFVPKFAKIFTDMGRELPGSIRFLMTISDISLWGVILVPILAVLLYSALNKIWGPKLLRFKLYSLLLGVPGLGRIVADLEMCKYIRTLSILIGNHVEIIRTVRISERVLHNPVIHESFTGIDRKLKGGAKLSAALNGNRYVPSGLVPMLRVGEESGTVAEMLSRITDHLESDTRTKIKRLLSLFEPVVIISLALVVLVVVVSIFMAMMEMNSITQGGPK